MLLAPESNEAMDARDARLLAYQAEQNAREAGCSQEQIDHYAGRELGVS